MVRYSLVALLICCLLGSAWGAPVLTGDTSRPEMSTFAVGEPVQLTFQVRGLTLDDTLTVQLRFVNALDQQLDTREIPEC